jgi:hypothetical protein
MHISGSFAGKPVSHSAKPDGFPRIAQLPGYAATATEPT